MSKKVTLRDIATETGSSVSTVSRVLNNSLLIPEDTRRLILKTVNQLGYKPRQTKKQSNRAIITIRLFLPQATNTFTHFFYDVAELIEAITEGFAETKVNIITSINNSDLSIFDQKKLGDIGGCVFAFTSPSKDLENQLTKRNIPFILLNREQHNQNYVTIDNQKAMEQLVSRAFLKKQNLKPCYIGFKPNTFINTTRQKGIKTACKSLGIPFSSGDAYMVESVEYAQNIIFPQILKKKYNCIFCFNDLFAISIYHAAMLHNVNIPNDILLCGFDNSAMLQLMDKRITSVEFSVKTMGKEAGLWLKSCIISKEKISCKKIIPAVLIPGDTL